MKAWRKFVDTLELTKDLEQGYFQMRKIFQREGVVRRRFVKTSILSK
jgi:hypothetical protein